MFRGFGIVMLFHLGMTLLTMGLWLVLLGIFQLAYVIPIARKAHKRHEKARLQGVLIAAGVTVLVNGICDAVVLPNLK